MTMEIPFWYQFAAAAFGAAILLLVLKLIFGVEQLRAGLLWPFGIFTEPDGNGGKASISRILGFWVTIKIIHLVEATAPDKRASAVPEAMIYLFMVLIGYQLLSKTLLSLGPGFLDLAKAVLMKVMGGTKTPDRPTP
jgi:glycerol uptake facilitator-like aquaporin